MKKLLLGLSILLVLCFVCSCFAIDDFTVTESIYDSETKTIRMIVNDNRASGTSPNGAEASIEGVPMTDVTFGMLDMTEVPVTFVFVVDTTTTGYLDQYDIPSTIAKTITDARSGKNDQYYLISYDTEVHNPVGPSKFASEVLKDLSYTVKGMSDYTLALQKAVQLLNVESKNVWGKKVIILISDGYLDPKPNKSQDELIDLMMDAGYPVYACGLKQSESQSWMHDDLKKLENISKNSGGQFYSLENNQMPGKDIISHINRSGIFSGVIGDDFSKEEPGQIEVNIQLLRNETKLSSLNAKAWIDSVNLPEETKSTEVVCENPDDPTCQGEKEKTPIDIVESPLSTSEKIQMWLVNNLGPQYLLICIAALLLIALIVLILLTVLKPGGKGGKIEEVPVDDDGPKLSQEPMTLVFEDLNNGRQYKAFISVGQSQVFGRVAGNDVIGLGGDPHIGRRQFLISATENGCTIEDLGSVNKTFLNGVPVRDVTEIKSGYRIRIGSIAGEREYSFSVSKKA